MYVCDTDGNLTESGEQKETTAHYSYSSDNRLAAWGDYPTEMDQEGNLRYLTDGRDMDAYTYDARNRLIRVMRKLVNIIYCMMKNKTPYIPSPLTERLAS